MIIGISGKIGSGKDTVGKIIQYLTCKENGIHSLKEAKLLTNISYQEYYEGFRSVNHVETNWQVKKFAGKLKQIISLLTGIPIEDLEKQEVKDNRLGKEWNYLNANGYYKSPKFITIYEAANFVTKMGNGYIEKKCITVRELLQQIGTNAMRDVIHPNIWVNALFTDYYCSCGHKISSENGISHVEFDTCKEPNWIITDMRFPNEMEAVKNRNGITIRVNRPKPICICTTLEAENCNIKCSKSVSFKEHESERALDNAEFDYTINNDGTIEELIEKVKEILIAEKII